MLGRNDKFDGMADDAIQILHIHVKGMGCPFVHDNFVRQLNCGCNIVHLRQTKSNVVLGGCHRRRVTASTMGRTSGRTSGHIVGGRQLKQRLTVGRHVGCVHQCCQSNINVSR